jgi:hypothetical protein
MKSSLFLFIAFYIFSCVILSKIPSETIGSLIGLQAVTMINETFVNFEEKYFNFQIKI